MNSTVGCLALLLLMMGQAWAQADVPEGYIVNFDYTRLDVPRSNVKTCVRVDHAGRFRLEQFSDIVRDPKHADVYEGTLAPALLEELTAILDAATFRELSFHQPPSAILIRDGEIVGVAVPRPAGVQRLAYVRSESSAPLPDPVNSLVRWLKQVLKQKGKKLKAEHASFCEPPRPL
jgi:hypothetical protein